MFSVLGLPPLAGRGFRAEDERPGAERVAVVGEALWRRRFGGDAAIVGQSITLNGERHQVIGVVPRAFREVGRAQIDSAGASPQIFVPLTIDPARENRGNRVVRVVGRLRPGVSLDRARDEMRRIAAAMEQEFPATNKDWGVRLETLYDSMLDERVRPSLLVLLAAVGMVLLIACANVANVLLARGISRQRELALRTALGAGRSRLVRQLVTESVCLAVVSGACGLLLAVFAVQTLRVMLPPTLTRIDEISVDATVLGVGLLLSLASGLFMGLVPAVRASRVALVPSLVAAGQGGRRSLGNAAATRHRRCADGPRDDAARGCGAASAEFRPAAAGPPRVRPRRRDHREDLAAPRPVSGCGAHVGLLAPTAGIARRHATGTVRGGRDHGAIRARCARGRQGAGPSTMPRGSRPWSTW